MNIFRCRLLAAAVLVGALSVTALHATAQTSPTPQPARKGAVKITLLQIGDLHGQMDSHPDLFLENGKIVFHERGGLAHIKTLVDRERAANPGRTILLDGGDLYQGDGYSVLSRGEDMIEPLKYLGYDFIIPGNWEVIYGKNQMIKLENSFGTKPISENMYHTDTFVPIFPGSYVKEIEGIRLGFISLNDPDVPVRQNPQMSNGITFTEPDARLKEKIDAFVKANRIDTMFLVTHLGVFKQIALADSPISEKVDYVLGNDTHERIRKPFDRKYAKVTEPGAFGTFVGKLELNFIDGKLIWDNYTLLDVDPAKYPADEKMAALVAKAEAPYRAQMEKVIGHTATPIYRYMTVETPMDNMITDAIRAKTGTQVALSNGFRYGNPIVPENGKPAAITMANLYNMLPVNTRLKTGRVKGAHLKEWLEKEINNAFSPDPKQRFGGYLVRFSGMEMRFEPALPKGERITSLKVGGTPLSPDAQYTVTSVVMTGAPESNFNRLPNVTDVKLQDFTIHDAVIDYLAKNPVVSPKLDRRAFSTSLGEESFSTIPGTDYQFR